MLSLSHERAHKWQIAINKTRGLVGFELVDHFPYSDLASSDYFTHFSN